MKENSDINFLGVMGMFLYVSQDEDICNETYDEGYVCWETATERFKPVTPARAAKYCQSAATDTFGTGQMYVGFDLLADIKVPRKH